jgi:hypothetical protein
MGDGSQRVALILYYIVNSPHRILGIEEPELSLHPGAQKRFRQVLDRLCSKYQKQLLVTTHSPVFLDGWEAASLFKVDISKGKSVLSAVADREQAIGVARMLGISPGDSFVADGIIWVEGPSDVSIYTAFLQKLGIDLEAKNVLLMWGGGDAMQHLSVSELQRLNPNFAVMLDSERTSSQKQIAAWKKRLCGQCNEVGAFAFVTQRRAIENYFSLRAVRQHYNKRDLPLFGEYVELAAHISAHIPGRSYGKIRDAGPIVANMTAKEIENLGDLTQALRSLQSIIARWKGSE